ncbi:MAG: protein kinase, partial [Actinomycetota bacterium]|nr:protein kinase [Actinomycetota bacterium]
MAIDDPFVLPADVAILPVADLPEDLRRQIDHSPGDYSVTRPLGRSTSSIVDSQTAALLERFRSPTTIVDAVIGYSVAEGSDPRATLDEAFGVLAGFVNEGLLVAADSELAKPIATSLAPGDRVGGLEVVAPAHAVIDTEVHLARAADGAPAALKIARVGHEARMAAAFANEAGALRHLDGRVTPRLLELGEHDGRPFLAMSWFNGVDVHQAAAEARSLGGAGGRVQLLGLAECIIGAYAHLHEQGVVHGDVHPRNALVDAAGAVAIIDFGLAVRAGGGAAGPRGGIDFFMEPEVARAHLARRPPPPPTSAGEQYCLAAMLYLLLTGAHTHAFSLEPEPMLRQLVKEPPLPFRRHGTTDLPAVEAVLGRALAKEPGDRYPSTTELLASFRDAAARDQETAGGARTPPPPSSAARELLDDVLARLAVPGDLFAGELPAPTASAMNGGAGFGYALLRLAALRDDEDLLALADLWATRSQAAAGSDEAFWSAELEIVPEVFGERSFYHHAPGVHCVAALVARARGDEGAQRLALEAFTAAVRGPCEHLDVAFGRAGLLLGCAMALESLPPAIPGAPLRT